MSVSRSFALVCVMLVLASCAQVPEKKAISQPPVVVMLSTTKVEPGRVVKLSVDSRQAGWSIEATGWWQDKLLLTNLPKDPQRYVGYVSVPLDMPLGEQELVIAVKDANQGMITQHRYRIEIIPRPPFKITKLWIKKFGKYKFAPESTMMAQARRQADFQAATEIDSFIWPVTGRISGKFGTKRIYNGGVSSWYHGGLDIAAPGGTPILAPADGVVILSENFTAHGKTILIDHGFGVVTTYLHQKERLVKVGDQVKKGQIIGRVGTTGSSTGNHLHFQINIHSVVANPYDFLPKQDKYNKKINN